MDNDAHEKEAEALYTMSWHESWPASTSIHVTLLDICAVPLIGSKEIFALRLKDYIPRMKNPMTAPSPQVP